MSELKPCPFCGGEAKIEEIPGTPFTDESYAWGVGCNECNIGWYEEQKSEAIAKWNRRTQPENKPLTLDELRQMGGEPVYCVDADGSGAWALVHTQDEVCTDANYGDWEFYCYGWRDGGKMNENGWLAYRHKPERSEG
jgi:Lar family restriction alleviation protein